MAFVGSSNVWHSALRTGIEWNLRVERDRDPAAYAAVVAAFERHWATPTPLSAAWVDRYIDRVQTAGPAIPYPSEEDEPDAPASPPVPSSVQVEALKALAASRVVRMA